MNARVELGVGGERLALEFAVPAGPARPRHVLPMAQDLANQVVDQAVRRAGEQGARVSCRKGCGACCRQFVPIAETEAYHLAELLAALPEPRQAVVRERFRAALARLEEAGFALDPERFAGEDTSRLGLAYFHLGIACPFLEDESCSIHLQRPISCREYLVTSPAQECARPEERGIVGVAVAPKTWTAFARLGNAGAERKLRWVPLIAALRFAEAHPEPAPSRSGPELAQEFLSILTGARVPGPPDR